MAINNDVYYNAVFIGALEANITGRNESSATATDYLTETQIAEAIALEVDSLIAEDALVSTGGGDASVLASDTSTHAFNTQQRSQLLGACTRAILSGRRNSSTTQSFYATVAAAIKALWTEGLLKLTNAA